MDLKERAGRYQKTSVAGENYATYIPNPLPPEPPLQMDKIYPLLEKASVALGRLDSLSSFLPDSNLFLYMYIRKEAVLSSQIEGTQSSLSDLLMYENEGTPGVPEQDVIEVSNYVKAMEHGLTRLNEGFPLCLRLIQEIHAVLLSHGRGSGKQPGEFRRSQNWIGGTRPGNAKFVPPPQEQVMDLLGALERFLHDDEQTLPTLVKAALVHVHFETIHPFLDGNGRLGRLLITFILCSEKLLSKPLLYLSLYFKTHRQAYYDHLQAVRETGDWEGWLQFFLEGVVMTATQAVRIIESVMTLFEEDRQKIEKNKHHIRASLLVFHSLEKHPVTDPRRVAEICQISKPTANNALNNLVNLGILKEITGRERGKIFSYRQYLGILSEGIEIIE